MTKKNTPPKRSSILETVHDSAKGLHKIGLINKVTMKNFDLLCLQELPDYSPKKIKLLRKKYDISQAVLAAVINTSVSTVQKWEIGNKHPSGPSLKLLNILDRKGLNIFIG